MKPPKAFKSIKEYLSDPENAAFVIFFLVMAIYYGWRMFKIAPWYDELYTYNFFISRGPVYAGIHWPLPNNHMGYSALGGLLYVITHDPYISLRGISYLTSLGNLIMLYILARRIMMPGLRLLMPLLYAGAWEVNTISIQGRGYALSANMMLLAVICLMHLCFDEEDKLRYYVMWVISLVIGFYTVMTTLYWVITVCFCALCCLLSQKKTKRLIRVIIASVWGAVGTVFVYSMVWLAIGSNLMSKDESSTGFGLSHFTIIRKMPVKALTTGAQYMLDTPYIQSVEREGYVSAFGYHMYDMIGHMYKIPVVIIILMLLAVVLAAVTVISRHIYLKKNTEEVQDEKGNALCIFSWLVICFVLVTPAAVFAQTKLPYIRVFTYYGAAVSLALTYVIYVLFGALRKYFTYGICAAVAIYVFANIFSADYNIAYGEREEAVLDLMKQCDLSALAAGGNTICLTDCNQEYMYRFVYDEYPVMTDISEADIIVVDKDMLDPDAEFHWEFYFNYSTLDHERLSGMRELLRNTYYEIYATDAVGDTVSR